MRFILPAFALFWAAFAAPSTLFGTSIVPFVDPAEASLYSECVVLARAVETFETTVNGTTYLETRFETLDGIKGQLVLNETFKLRPLSRSLGKSKIAIAGDFQPENGKTYLLFLQKREDFWRPVLLSYYVFEQFQKGPDKFLVPLQGAGVELLSRPDARSVEPLTVFRQDSFIRQLKQVVAGSQPIWNPGSGLTAFTRQDFEATDRAVPVGCDFTLGGPGPARWQNPAIPIFYDNTNNPANWGTKFGNILSALNTNYTGIDPSNAGSKAYTPDCGNGSAIEGNFLNFCDNNLGGAQCALLIFDDPCNEIGDLSGCAGVLAFGGSYSSGEFHTFDGTDWENAVYGFVLVNNGVPACLNDQQYEQMLTHELTHVYRMGHLDGTLYPGQNMNPFCCNNINNKDKECMNYAYPVAAPVELLTYEAQVQENGLVHLKWVTESEKNNAYFTLQRATDGLDFTEIQQITGSENAQGDTYEYLDTRPLPGLSYYRLGQTDFDGTLQWLGIKAVKREQNEAVIRVSPNPVETQILSLSFDSPEDQEGMLEVLHTDGRILARQPIEFKKGVQVLHQTIDGLPSGLYFLRLSFGYQQFSTRFLKR